MPGNIGLRLAVSSMALVVPGLTRDLSRRSAVRVEKDRIIARTNAELAAQHDSIDAAEHRKLVTQQGWLEAQIRTAS